MSIINKLLGSGLEELGENVTEKGLRKLVSSKGDDVIRKAATKLPGSYIDDVAQDIAVKRIPSLTYGDALVENNIAKNLDASSKFLGKPMYHSTDAIFDKFDDARLGSNTAYTNTGFGHFITPDEGFSKQFGNNIMQVRANIKNPITHPYGAASKYNDRQKLNQMVEDYLNAIDFGSVLDDYNGMIKNGEYNDLYDAYMSDMFFNELDPFENAAEEKALLKNKGYDAVEIVEGPKGGTMNGYTAKEPVSSYAVFDPANIEIEKVKKYLPVNGGDVAQDIPVYGKNELITDDSIFNDPAFADILKNNNKESVKAKATLNDLAMMKRAKAGKVLSAEEIANSRFVRNLGIDAKKAKLKYGELMTDAMEKGKEAIPVELEQRMRGMADTVLDKLHKDPNVKYERKAVIFMGGPSSGKSSAGMKLYDAAKGGDYAVIDSDDIKPMFEEFGKGEGAGAVHLASAYTAKKMVLPDAAAEGMNLALPIVGKSDNALNYHLDLLKNAGYDVAVVDVSLPTDKAASRNFGRMLETNRNVEDNYVRNVVDQKPADVFKKMVDNIKAGKDKRASGYARISNDVKLNEPQILEEIMPTDILKRVQEKFGKNRK